MGKFIRFTHKKKDMNAVMYNYKQILKRGYLKKLNKYGEMGVEALKAATPRDTGKTAESWKYRIEDGEAVVKIIWYNTNENKGENIAILLQYGHGTTNGGYVKGRDYINPALQPVFEKMVNDLWKEVTSTI